MGVVVTILTEISSLRNLDKGIAFTVLAAALGYFVDIFDLLIFIAARVTSLKDMGVPEADLLSTGVFLINVQMAGLFVGGFLWGILSDKFGRLSVLLASILFYSLATLANAFIDNVPLYTILRFVAGVGLAGEIGIGVTLASELLPIRYRGLGTTFIATVGILGAVVAGIVVDFFGWRGSYIIGGVMGFALLFMRMTLKESGMYLALVRQKNEVVRGSLLSFLKKASLLKRYIIIAFIPSPILVLAWIIIAFTPEFAKAFGTTGTVSAGLAMVYCYVGLAMGDAVSGLVSQYWQSRKKAMALFMGLSALACTMHLTLQPQSVFLYYAFCAMMGFTGGYWVLFIQIGAEQFGTNIRATAATSLPTLSRGIILILFTMGFRALIPYTGIVASAGIILAISLFLSVASLCSIKESFHDSLDFVE